MSENDPIERAARMDFTTISRDVFNEFYDRYEALKARHELLKLELAVARGEIRKLRNEIEKGKQE